MKRCPCGGEVRKVGYRSDWGLDHIEVAEFLEAESRGENPEMPPATETRTDLYLCIDCGKAVP